VVGKRVLREIFGPKKDEVMGGSRKLHNEELHNLYSSPSIIRMVKSRKITWAGHVARIGAKRNVYRILVGKPKGKNPLGTARHRCEDIIKMDLRETGWASMNWIHLARDRDKWRAVVNMVKTIEFHKMLRDC
jgi:hypothetical protein